MEVSEVDVSSGVLPVAGSGRAAAKGLAERAHLAVLWTTGFQFFWDILQFGVTLTLVRLLPPEAYGQVSLVTTVIGFLTVLSFRETLTYAMQVRDDARTHYQDQFTAGAVVQLAVFAATNIVALALRRVPSYAPVAPLVHLMSITFILDLPSHLRLVMLERSLSWGHFRLLHGIGLLIGAVLSILMALGGFGVYSLLVPSFAVPLVITADLFFVAGWRPTWQWRWDHYRPAFRFGISRMTAVSFVSGAVLLESSWLARGIGFTALGLYNRAVGLAQLACQRVSALLTASLYPVLTKIEPNTDRYRRASALFLRSVSWVVIPVAMLLSIVAFPVVRTIYGTKWLEAVPYVPLALTIGATMAIVQTAYTLLLAHQEQALCLRADVWRLVGTGLALALALPFGVRVYLAGMVVVHLVSLALVLRWLGKSQAISLDGVLDAFAPPLLVAAAAFAVCRAAGFWSGIYPTGIGQAIAYGVLFGILYLSALRGIYYRQLEELVRYLPSGQRIGRLLRFQEAA